VNQVGISTGAGRNVGWLWVGRYLRKGAELAHRAGVEAAVGVHRERKVAERRTKKPKMRE
jgi:NAD(P)-dependent dehydrogenase (short-subunit alcohol dehydrogenase family)